MIILVCSSPWRQICLTACHSFCSFLSPWHLYSEPCFQINIFLRTILFLSFFLSFTVSFLFFFLSFLVLSSFKIISFLFCLNLVNLIFHFLFLIHWFFLSIFIIHSSLPFFYLFLFFFFYSVFLLLFILFPLQQILLFLLYFHFFNLIFFS